MKCIYCDHPHTYLLADAQHKCSKCKRKFSLKKIAREKKLFSHFKEGISARKTAFLTKMHFATVQKYFEKFRYKLLGDADRMYQNNAHKITQYDEYLYLPVSLKPKNNTHKIQHFLTLSYDNTIYCIMMPTIKNSLLYKQSDTEHKLLDKYLRFNKISKIVQSKNIITDFWNYFETFICQYKGVSSDNFILYLKEAEWRFNLLNKVQKIKSNIR